MNQSRTIRTCIATGLALGLTFGLTGCGKATEKLSEKAAEKIAEKAAGGNANVDIDSKDGSFSIDTDEGSFNVGGGEIPADWPSEVPLPKGFKPASTMNLSSDGETNIMMSGTTDMSVDGVIDFYADAMSDWKEEGKHSMSGDGTTTRTIVFTKDAYSLTVSANDDGDNGATAVSFIYATSGDNG